MAFTLVVFEIDAVGAAQLGDLLLEAGALSVTTEDAASGTEEEQPIFDEPGETATWPRLRLRVLIDEGMDSRILIDRACARAGLAVPDDLRVQAVPHRDWVRETQAQFGTIPISARLWIVPSWHALPEPPAIVVSLDPGVAFGTGSHPTTRLCLQWLERHVHGGEVILDYGCGSGILAIAAMKLGAARAFGVDIDPAAVDAARENARRNGVACEFLDSRAQLAIEADIVVANILANPLKLLAPLLSRQVRGGGRIALSGILERQRAEVEESCAPWFDFEIPSRDEGWVCLSGVRKAP